MGDLLDWSEDAWSEYSDNPGAIMAEDGDWKFHIWPVRAPEDEIVGYRIYVGNLDSGYWPRGSVEIDGEPGELTLDEAKVVAEAEVRSRLDEVNGALRAVVSDWRDSAGNSKVRTDANGALSYQVDESGDVGIRIFATTNFDDWFDPTERFWAVGWNNLYNHAADLESLLQQQITAHKGALGL